MGDGVKVDTSLKASLVKLKVEVLMLLAERSQAQGLAAQVVEGSGGGQ